MLAVLESGNTTRIMNITEMHVFDQWCHLGSVKNHQELEELSASPCSDRDTYRYLLKFLNRKDVEVIALHG